MKDTYKKAAEEEKLQKENEYLRWCLEGERKGFISLLLNERRE